MVKQTILPRSLEKKYDVSVPKRKSRDPYPWEEKLIGGHHRITREFFRCKGSSLNPVRKTFDSFGNPTMVFDCDGKARHSLPMKNDQEYIYPVLIEILNFIQGKTEKKVIVTSGHRCPVHNTYVDESKRNQTSKHLIGAEVDFYVKGMENKPEKIVQIIEEYYQSKYLEPAFTVFLRENRGKQSALLNKEILVRIHQKNEERNFDNRHPYPYISLEVRFDSEENTVVNYNWSKAHKGYLQW